MSKENGRVDRDAVKRRLEQAFRAEFPTDTVDVSDGYSENIHVLVVSRRFDSMTEKQKQDLLWSIVDRIGLAPDEESLIKLLMPVSPAEIK